MKRVPSPARCGLHRFLAAAAITWIASCLPGTAGGQVRFADVTRQAGLAKPLEGIMGHGAAWGDYDGDGWIDLFVGGFCDRPDPQYRPAEGPVPAKLLRNRGDGGFEPAGQPAVEFFGRTSGAVFADLDNNGTLELVVANSCRLRSGRAGSLQSLAKARRSALFRNDRGTLVDISAESGVFSGSLDTARNIGVLDYDADGLLDLFMVEDRFGSDGSSQLLKNLGGLRFRPANRGAKLPEGIFGFGLAVADVNGDCLPDLFVPHSNRFFLSAGDGTYRESDRLNRTFAFTPQHGEDWPCGAAFGDLNVDGRLDLVLAIHARPARNRVYLNEGSAEGVPQFRDVTTEAGWPESLPEKCPHVEIQDFDNDGLPDVYLSAGWLDGKGNVTPLIYRNTGTRNGVPRFAPLAKPKPDAELVYFPAGPSGDFDRDGRLDLFLVNWFAGNRCRLLKNHSPPRRWLDVQVTGRSFNRMGIGSQIKVYRAGGLGNSQALIGFQELATGYGYASGQPAVCHFGLGETRVVDLEARLPDGNRVARRGVAANQVLLIEEPEKP